MMLFLARGIEDDHYWVVRELDGTLVETPWRVEHEDGGWVLSHADDPAETARVLGLGACETADSAVRQLRALLED